MRKYSKKYLLRGNIREFTCILTMIICMTIFKIVVLTCE